MASGTISTWKYANIKLPLLQTRQNEQKRMEMQQKELNLNKMCVRTGPLSLSLAITDTYFVLAMATSSHPVCQDTGV